jgi:sugar phosphate isomerase/epimerase
MSETRPTIALQMYTLRDLTTEDMAGTLKQVAEMGYEGVELAGYGNLQVEEVQRACKDNNLKVVGLHVSFDALTNSFEKIVDDSLLFNTKYIVCPSLPDAQRTAEGYPEFGRGLNDIGARANSAGLVLCYHNHHFEFDRFNGEYGLDLLFANSDPKLVQAEIDTFWVQTGGADPAAYIEKYAGRAPLIHIKDMAKDEKRGFAEVGAGSLDWPSIFAAAEKGGAVAYSVEQDVCPGNPLDSIRISIDNLKKWGKLG